ncbi:MAG: hypothetical protein CSA62_15035 [Planctomycetota bacterium]|nr:MAG: hypothetical protein CSA62_15035 [Planctomycetota bacterium]
MPELERLAILAPFGIWPKRNAGAEVVYGPAARLAAAGTEVDIFSLGLRRFERHWPRPFSRELAPRLREHRVLRLRLLLDRVLRGTARVPPLDLSRWLHGAPPSFQRRLRDAQLIQIESPWAIDYARSLNKPLAFVVHNHECDLHQAALGSRGLLQRAQELEARAWRESDVIFVAHEAERQRFEESYGPTAGTQVVLPFGIDLATTQPANAEQRLQARARLGIPQGLTVGLFPGSAHAPNLSAAAFLREQAKQLAEAGVFVLIAGSVSPIEERFEGGLATGPLEELSDGFAAADFGLHPITEGSGMNLKLAQMLGHGLPVLATPFGARGYQARSAEGLRLCELGGFVAAAAEWAQDAALLIELGRAARQHAERQLDWNAISARRREALQSALAGQ